jgi:hypothetical protein
MKLINRKSKLQKLLETAGDSLNVPSGVKSSLPDLHAGKGLKRGLLAAGGLVGLTAGSAGISSLRRRKEGARGDS